LRSGALPKEREKGLFFEREGKGGKDSLDGRRGGRDVHSNGDEKAPTERRFLLAEGGRREGTQMLKGRGKERTESR